MENRYNLGYLMNANRKFARGKVDVMATWREAFNSNAEGEDDHDVNVEIGNGAVINAIVDAMEESDEDKVIEYLDDLGCDYRF